MDRNSSPSPPKDPYPTAEITFDNKIAKLEERTFDTVDHPSKKLSSSTSEVVEKHLPQQQKNSNATVWQDEQLSSNLVDNTKLTRADQISIRPDTLRAAKRRLKIVSFFFCRNLKFTSHYLTVLSDVYLFITTRVG